MTNLCASPRLSVKGKDLPNYLLISPSAEIVVFYNNNNNIFSAFLVLILNYRKYTWYFVFSIGNMGLHKTPSFQMKHSSRLGALRVISIANCQGRIIF